MTTDTTSTNGIAYVESISGGSAVSKTTKYMKFSAGTTPKSGATPVHTSTNSGANSGTAVKAVTGYASFSGGSLTGTTKFNTDAIKSIGGTRNYGFSASTSNVMYSPTVSNGVLSWSVANASTQDAHTGTAASTGTVGFTAASLGIASTADVAPSGHTHTYDKTTSITLTDGTAPSMNFDTKTNTDTPYISAVSGGSAVSATTKYLHHSHSGASATTKYLSAAPSNTSTASAGPSATTTFVTAVAGGTTTATTKYLEHTHTAPSISSSAKAVTAVAANGTASVAPSSHTHTVTAAGTVELTRGTAPSLGAATTGTVGISGGSITPTTYYLEHGHTAASLGTASTANAAPHTHTHSYGSSTALITTANSGTAVSAVTAVEASTD